MLVGFACWCWYALLFGAGRLCLLVLVGFVVGAGGLCLLVLIVMTDLSCWHWHTLFVGVCRFFVDMLVGFACCCWCPYKCHQCFSTDSLF